MVTSSFILAHQFFRDSQSKVTVTKVAGNFCLFSAFPISSVVENWTSVRQMFEAFFDFPFFNFFVRLLPDFFIGQVFIWRKQQFVFDLRSTSKTRIHPTQFSSRTSPRLVHLTFSNINYWWWKLFVTAKRFQLVVAHDHGFWIMLGIEFHRLIWI